MQHTKRELITDEGLFFCADPMTYDQGRHKEIRERVVDVLQKGAYKDY